ncbi:hypothetical protein GmRootV118_59490 [Variovorax sp. V118]
MERRGQLPTGKCIVDRGAKRRTAGCGRGWSHSAFSRDDIVGRVRRADRGTAPAVYQRGGRLCEWALHKRPP